LSTIKGAIAPQPAKPSADYYSIIPLKSFNAEIKVITGCAKAMAAGAKVFKQLLTIGA
jgi:hypothetical protein